MNLRNKYLGASVRILLGALFVFSGIGGFYAISNGLEGIPEPMIASTQVLIDTGIFHMIKVTEIVAGLMLLIGFLPALALLSLAPIGVGIIVFNSNVSPENLPFSFIVVIAIAYLGYYYFDKYRSIFKRK